MKPSLIVETKIELQETERSGIKSYHLGAFITKATFNEMCVENPTSAQMAEITGVAASQWVKMEVEEHSILGEIYFEASLPPSAKPNIAICYNNKFRVDNHPAKDIVAEKMTAARNLVDIPLEFIFTADHLQFLIPTESATAEIVNNLKISNATTAKQINIETVPLTNFNAGSNLISLKLNSEQSEILEDLAAKVTGSKESAKPTNAMNQVVPFSFTLAKMPNLIPCIELELETCSKATLF